MYSSETLGFHLDKLNLTFSFGRASYFSSLDYTLAIDNFFPEQESAWRGVYIPSTDQ